MGRRTLLLAGFVLGIAVPFAELARAEDPPSAAVPEVRRMLVADAARAVQRAGFALGTVQEVVNLDFPEGTVVQQQPGPLVSWTRGAAVNVRVAARRDGPVRTWLPPPPPQPAPAAPGTPMPRPPPPGPVAPAGTPAPPPPPPPPPEDSGPPLVPPESPPTGSLPEAPPAEPPVESAPEGRVPEVGPEVGPAPDAGTPDAPAVAGPVDPGHVPALLGLPLADAEFRAGQAGMVLSVERVPGHPVGRVLSQVPEAGSLPAPGGLIKVRITAGGDARGTAPPAPVAEIPDVRVPDLLDRTAAQAHRILEDMGLSCVVEEVDFGPPGRVADQTPHAGDVVPRGTPVSVRIATIAVSPRGTTPPAPPPAAPPPERRPSTIPPGPLAAPSPVSPPDGTVMPEDRALTMAFAWRPVAGADAYVLEIEEQGPDGWIASVRKSVRASAATVEFERLSPGSAALRWRVRALASGREGPACGWVSLR